MVENHRPRVDMRIFIRMVYFSINYYLYLNILHFWNFYKYELVRLIEGTI